MGFISNAACSLKHASFRRLPVVQVFSIQFGKKFFHPIVTFGTVLLCSLLSFSAAYAGTHAAGNPVIGATYWSTTYVCASCHGATPANTSFDAAFGTAWAATGPHNTLAYYAANPANISTGVAGAPYMGASATPGTNAYNAVTFQNDLSAYFASLLSPVLNTPITGTYASAATYSNTISGVTGQDYLVSNTAYTATLGTISYAGFLCRFGGCYSATVVTFTPTNWGSYATFSGALPTVTTPTVYRVRLTATNANNAVAGLVEYDITVNPPAPVISSGAAGSGTVGVNATQYTITASNSPTGYGLFSGTLPPGTSLVGASVTGTPTTAGTYNAWLSATNAGGTSYVYVTFTVGVGSQSITFGAAPTVVVGGTGIVSATGGGSGNPIIYSVPVTTGICSVTGTTVTGLATGTCTVAANQAGNTNYNAAPQVTQSFTVGAGSQTILFGAAPTVVVGGTGIVSATGGASGNAVTYSVPVTTSICSVSGSTVTGLAAGTCTIAANQAGNTNYNAAAQVTQSFTVGAGSQTITFGAAPTVLVGGTGTVSATGGASGNAVTFSVPVTTSICSVTGSTVTGLAAGTCTIAANQAGNANYNAAPQVTQSISVGLTAQNISFGPAPTMTFGGGTATVSATGGGSGNPVIFSVPVTTSICAVSGNTVTALAAGTCTIAANQAGNGAFSAASQVTQNITINKANQSVAFGAAPTLVVGGTGAVSATGGASGNTVTFSVPVTTGICSVTGSTVTGLASGTCTVAANQAGSGNYNAATQVTQSFTVGAGSQTIAFGAAPAIVVGGTGTVSASGGASGNAVTYSVPSTTSICSVTGSTVTGLAAGTCTVAANQAGNADYNAAPQQTQSFGIGQAGQTISFGAAPAIAVGGTGTVTASATSGLAVTYSSTTLGVCTISGNTVTGVAVGTCSIAANQAGNANYTAAPAMTQNISIGQGSQSISFGSAPAVSVGGTATVSATATSGLAVSYSSLTGSVCTVSGNAVTGVIAGTCTIAANQSGNANYAAAPQVTQNITVSNLPPATTAASMGTTLNTAATFDLAPYITGTAVNGVSISAQPAHGKVSVAGTRVTYTPAQDYFGTDTFAYLAYGIAGVSPSAAIVTVTITGRPDPLKDARVTGLVNIETAAAKRFDKAQIFNFQQRLESRHHAMYKGSPAGAPDEGGVPTTVAGTLPGQTRSYFNSWQPGTVVSYANDPATLLHTADRLNDGAGAATDPAAALLANVVKGALTSSSLNLTTISNAVGAAQEESFSRLEVWAAGNLRFGTRSQAGVDTRFSTDGISVGVDKRLDRHLTLGLGMGYAHDKSSIGSDGTNSASSGNSVAGYASYQMDAGTFVDALLGYGKVNFDTNRYVASVNDFARASRKGDQIFGSLAFGYEYRNDGLLWSPYGRYDFSVDRLNAGSESGAGANALSYASQTSRNSQLAFGLRAQSVHQASFGVVQPHARVEYQRGIDTSGQTSIAYADLLGTQYTVAATTQNTNSFVLGLGSEFLLSDTLRFVLDYQRLRSGGRENYQSINFRLTKDLEGKNDLAALLAESYSSSIAKPSGLMVAAGFAYDDNVSRASAMLDKLSDTIYSLTVSKAKAMVISQHTRLTVSGFLDFEKFRTYAGLGRVSGGVQGEYVYRPSGEFGSPTYGIFARFTSDQYESTLRDGSRRSAGVTLRKPLTDRINLFASAAENTRVGKSDVFNTRDVSARLNLDYALATDKTIYLTGEYRKGDIVSSGRSSLAILDISTVFVRDDVFNASGFFDYRMKGKTTLWTMGYNLSLGAKDSLDFAWRRAQSKPDKAPIFAAPAMRYIDNQYSVSYLMAF